MELLRAAPVFDIVREVREHVSADSLNRFDFIEHDQHVGLSRIAEDRQQPLQEVQCTEVIDVSLHSRITLRAGCHIRLPCQTGQNAVGGRLVSLDLSPAVAVRSFVRLRGLCRCTSA